ncbi:HutD family protein [Anaerosphaera multitolerans]|uniref:HutD family protein n=1 Tax=Anaerosphaera multitolerans TaxID=2487351 RepID=A0A437S7P3_9FIRM|nr:HutD family protein [Anaerosphaera multitolerans]RVU55110.1 hypothetical protein EF514_04260 [Anaerosphaera multitolerans]
MEIIKKEEFVTTDWSGGTTTEVYISPKGANVSERDFDYRVSTATCELDESVFSDYSGFVRFIAPVDANLNLKNGDEEITLRPYEVYRFDGSDSVVGYSKVRDFNLIFKKGLSGKMYSTIVNGQARIENFSKKMLIFNNDSEIEVNNKDFEIFSAIVLDIDEVVNFRGYGSLIICEMN